jgi:hypothetical protein
MSVAELKSCDKVSLQNQFADHAQRIFPRDLGTVSITSSTVCYGFHVFPSNQTSTSLLTSRAHPIRPCLLQLPSLIMVQIVQRQHDSARNLVVTKHPENWWKLIDPTIKTFRQQKGQFDYTTCDIDELRSFCIARGLVKEDCEAGGWDHFMEKLAFADANETFQRFSELPPELRVRIYEFYFNSFGVLNQPAEPPIGRVSRLLRTETLPVFYDVCEFRMDLTETQDGLESKSFFYNISPEYLGWIRKLVLIGNVYHRGCNMRMEWGIELGRWETYKWRSLHLVGAAETGMKRSCVRMSEFLQRLHGKEGKLRLTRADLDCIFKVLGEGWE